VKVHAFCCEPLRLLFWSSGLPATSLAPVVIIALYLVPLAKCIVVELPKGFRVATSPSMLRLTLRLVIWVVLPSGLTLKSLKVEVVIEEGIIFSEKVALRFEEGATPIALDAGEVFVTLGGPGTGSMGGAASSSAARHTSA
jgi:hypothetical protein